MSGMHACMQGQLQLHKQAFSRAASAAGTHASTVQLAVLVQQMNGFEVV